MSDLDPAVRMATAVAAAEALRVDPKRPGTVRLAKALGEAGPGRSGGTSSAKRGPRAKQAEAAPAAHLRVQVKVTTRRGKGTEPAVRNPEKR